MSKLRRGRPSAVADQRVVHQVASWCLGYPDADLLARIPTLRAALDAQRPSEPVRLLLDFVGYLDGADPAQLAAAYVDTFDLSRRQTLYLSYWADGDTRRRGVTLTQFKQRYRDSGWLVDTHGELPDYLPMVLEYAALADPAGGRELMQEHRAGIELIRLALAKVESPYERVLAAICATLPGPSPKDRQEAMALAASLARSGPPIETVGIDLLPMASAPITAAPRGMR